MIVPRRGHRRSASRASPPRRTALRLQLFLLPLVAASSSPAASPGGLANVDVSRAPGPQAEVRIAADPRSPSHLLAASNSDGDPGMRVYGSSNGGRSWTSEVLPSPPNSTIAPCHADPAPAFDASGN